MQNSQQHPNMKFLCRFTCL